MVDSLRKPQNSQFDELRPGVKAPSKDTILTPRFYTTDFDEMAEMDMSVNEDEVRAIIEEFRADYNRSQITDVVTERVRFFRRGAGGAIRGRAAGLA